MIKYPNDINLWPTVKVYGCDFRNELLDMAQTITRLELWEWMKNYTPLENKGFMFMSESEKDMISNGLKSNQHSGATFAHCMRCMEFIAKEGFDKFKSHYE
tara:strand:- start:1573 stop:1875 length:303 start_codon:yes stop_codon:yes gene_type:complete